MKYSARGKMAVQKQERSIESNKKNRSAQKEDPLWNIKEEILHELKLGPLCLSELAARLNSPANIILKALEEMKQAGVVDKRDYFEGDEDFQPWGIRRPSFFRRKHLNSK